MPTQPRRDAQQGGGSSSKADAKMNGNRSGFRTDTAISNGRFGGQRVLQPWVPDKNDTFDGSLEKTSSSGAPWDQFAENERLFGLKTDYDENIYTTAINKDHPQYRERIAAAEKKAREIERSAAMTAHVAEERVMDYSGGKDRTDDNEEDKYSGVRRQDFPPLASGRENRYMPPAKRAPAGQTTVRGAPVDPAIISSQIKVAPKRQQQPQAGEAPKVTETPKASEPSKASASEALKNGTQAKRETQKPADAQQPSNSSTSKPAGKDNSTAPAPVSSAPAPAPTKENVRPGEPTVAEKQGTNGRATALGSTSRPVAQLPPNAPSATLTVERDVLVSFKNFATQQRLVAEKARSNKAKADKEVKLTELKKFANDFKLSTPVPSDLVSIIAKDPAKQREIQAKAIKDAEEMAAKAKDVAAQAKKEVVAPKDAAQAKRASPSTTASAATEARPARGALSLQATPPNGGPGRHAGSRQQFPQQQYHAQGYRNGRVGPQHAPQPHSNSNTLAQRIRNVEQQRFSQPPAAHQHAVGPEIRAPPTGPANGADYSRRHSGHPGAKLNPNSNEFRPSPFAPTFNPNGHPSATSSPRSAVNHVSDVAAPAPAASTQPQGQLIRRKTKAVDPSKCCILAHIKTIAPPQGRNWDDNGGLRPAYDTLPTWRQLQDDEKPDSTMHLTYRELFERQPFAATPSMPTPNPAHVVPQLAHQHQLPFHLQHGAHNMMPRQSPHMPPMQMHTPQHGPLPHQPYGNDDHRMMHSNSAQSFASPRMGQLPVAYQQVNPGAQVPYGQPVYIGAGNPQLGQFRSYSNNPHYVPPQGQMGAPMMMQPQFMAGPQGMMAPPMMYGTHHPQFMPPAGPPQQVPVANGYPSPGRPAAPMMVHQGSQQSHNMYAMSPNIQYNQPAYGPAQAGAPMSNTRSYTGPGPQHFSPNPQQVPHHYSPQPPNSSGGNYNNHANHGAGKQQQQQAHGHSGPQANRTASTSPPNQEAERPDEAK
ncbi:PAB1-binding protein 1 [Trichoderma ghanense]|uniref:PAB1-binding protein 1 n=1 Tax=Trichoderma ghanense TaxID=65468 RepID=A0ABY2HDA8_9HYPO